MRDRIYKPDRTVKLRLARDGRVFDMNAAATVFLGIPLSVAAAAAFTGIFLWFLPGV